MQPNFTSIRIGRIILFSLVILLLTEYPSLSQGVRFNGNLSPAQGLITPYEQPLRAEICLNGRWQFQPVSVPETWIAGTGNPPKLTSPTSDKWDKTKIKIPSPWNINDWGGGSHVGSGTSLPYAPSSVYYPSYPQSWTDVKMGWLQRQFTIPISWRSKRLILHFEAIAGDAQIYVNGKKVAEDFDSYLPIDIDITDAVCWNKNNLLQVGVRHSRLFDKKNTDFPYMGATYPCGSNTENIAGIWQDVFLQAIPPMHTASVFIKPFVSRDSLEIQVELTNQSKRAETIGLTGNIREWINQAKVNGTPSAEIKWSLGETKLTVDRENIVLLAGESKTVTIRTKIDGRLKLWNPDSPNLYSVLLTIRKPNGQIEDLKVQRFGWRSFTIAGKDFLLNGKKIQCVGDLQHPFGPYVTSRRFAWAWYKMIKDVGGNAVRPHAQPWPRVYYDLADEMGLCVLDETALFGSSIRLNFEEDITWKRTADQIKNLILRDRNHPSVIGWSIGNELFAIALLNKPNKAVSDRWDRRIIELTKIPGEIDPTRQFITADGDKDMNGVLPVWSKHFGHGINVAQLPQLIKPIVVGESGATYYGKPNELYQFVGMKAYGTYFERNEALAIDVYQNVVQMARPILSWFSPSELCWFGIEHLNLGYHDFNRLPNLTDGIFPGENYIEGQPGYQFERIPPYVTTFNPGLDPSLPLYKPLPMFDAMKAALGQPEPHSSQWDNAQDTTYVKSIVPASTYPKAAFMGLRKASLARLLDTIGIEVNPNRQKEKFLIVDAETLTKTQLDNLNTLSTTITTAGGVVWIFVRDSISMSKVARAMQLPLTMKSRLSTALAVGTVHGLGRFFSPRDLYFSQMDGDKYLLKKEILLGGNYEADTIFKAAPTDWYLFNEAPENQKCAQIVLYEHLRKSSGVGTFAVKKGNGRIIFTSLDYNIINQTTIPFWRKLSNCLGLNVKSKTERSSENNSKKKHDLLLDGPISNQ